MKKRIVSLVLAFSIIGALCVPALAVESVSGYGYDTSLDTASGSYWSSYWSTEFNKVEKLMKMLGYLRDEGQFAGVSGASLSDYYYNWLYSTVGYGEVEDRLHTIP